MNRKVIVNGVQIEIEVVRRTALDGKVWFLLINSSTNTTISRYTKKRDALWQLRNFEQFPIFPY